MARELKIEVTVDTSNAEAKLKGVDASLDGVRLSAQAAAAATNQAEAGIRDVGAASVAADPKIKALHDEIAKTRTQIQQLAQQNIQAEASINKLGSGTTIASAGFGKLVGVIGAYVSVQQAFNFARATMEWADSLDELATGAGVSVEALQELGYAAQQNGASLQAMTNTLLNLAERVGSADEKTVAAIRGMGLSFETIRRLSPDQMFMAVAQGLRDVEDPAKRNALAMDAIGKSWKAMMPTILSDIDTLRREAPKMTEETVKALGKLNDTWAAWKLKLQVGIGNEIAQTEQDFAKLNRLINSVGGPLWTFGQVGGYFGGAVPPSTPGAPKGWGVGNALMGAPTLPGEAEEKALEQQVKDRIEAAKKAAQEAIEAQANITKAIHDWEDAYDTLGKAARRAAYAMLIAADASKLALIPSQRSDAFGTTFSKGAWALTAGGGPSAAGGTGGMFGAVETGRSAWGGTLGAISNLPANLLGAAMGGGSIGRTLGSALGSGIFGDLAKSVTGTLTKTLGGTLGKALGGAIPVVGGLVGDLLGGLAGKLFGPSQTQLAGREADTQADQLKAQLVQQYGSLEAIRTLGKGAGEELFQAFGRRGVDGLKLVSAAMEKFKRNLDLQAEIDTLNGQLADLKTQQIPTFDQITAAAQRYGLTLDGMGGAIQQMSITESATAILNDWNVLTTAGMDANAVAAAMSTQLNQLVQDAIRYGSVLPENMKPVLESLAQQGRLTDAAGQKITDLAGLQWGDPVKTEADKIATAIQDLIDKIGALVDKLNGLDGKKVHTEVETHHTDIYDPVNKNGPPADEYHSGGLIAHAGYRRVIPFPLVRAHSGLAVDEIPIIAQRGERVLSRAQNREWERGGGGNVIVHPGAVVINNPVLRDRAQERDLAEKVGRGLLQIAQARRRTA